MSAAPVPAAVERFGFASVLGRGLAVLGRNAVPFGGLALAITGAVMLIGLLTLDAGHLADDLAFQLLDTLAGNLVTATLVYGTVQELRGRHAGAMAAVTHGLRTLWPVLLLAVLMFVGIGLGIVFVIVPGLILMTMWWVAIPVAVIERPGVMASLGRSANLTAGYRWPILAIVATLFVLQVALSLVLGELSTLIDFAHAGAVADWLASAAVTVFSATVAAVGYYDLRVVKEGANIEQIAAVFD